MSQDSTKRLTKGRIEELIKDIKEKDTFAREKAVEILSSFPTKTVTNSTVPLLYEKDTAVRMAAVEVLKNVGKARPDEILSLFSDACEDVRIYACEIVAHIKEERAVPYLLKALKEDKENVRSAACVALGEFKRKDVTDALISALNDSEWVAFSAISSLGRIKDPRSIPQLLNVLKEDGGLLAMAACEALINFRDPETLRNVAQTVKGFSPEKRDVFLKVLVERVRSDLFPILYENFKDDLFPHLKEVILLEKKRSREILDVLRYFKDIKSVELIIELLNDMDEDHEDYDFVLEILSELKEVWAPNIETYLKEGKNYSEHMIQVAIREGLKIDESVLLNVFTGASLELKRLIVKNLDRVCEDGKKIISIAINDKDGHIRGDAAEVVGRKKLTEMEGQIIKLLKSDYNDVRIKALSSLILINRERAKSEIKKLMTTGTHLDKRVYAACSSMLTADENYPFVKELLESPVIEEKRLAMQVIEGFIDDERYAQFLTEILKSDSVPNEALKIIKDKKLTQFKEKVVEIFKDKDNDVWTRYFAISALSSFDDKTLFPVFVEAIDDENPLIRIAGIKGFLLIKEKKALEYILRLKEDKDQDVRMEAQYAAERLVES